MAVVQAVLLFGSETWLLTPQLEKTLEGFHHEVMRQMTGMGPKCQQDGTWVYKPIGAVLEMVGMEDIGTYIFCLQNTITQNILTRPMMYLCLVVE